MALMPVDNDENDVSVYFPRVRQTMLSSRLVAASLPILLISHCSILAVCSPSASQRAMEVLIRSLRNDNAI